MLPAVFSACLPREVESDSTKWGMINLAATIKLIVNRKWLMVFLLFLFSLFTIHYALFTPPAFAQEPPNPQPCQDPISPNPEILTHNWLVNEKREPPAYLHKQTATETGRPGARVTATLDFTFSVDFSKLSALFGPDNSNLFEGEFQSKEHKEADIKSLQKQDVNAYHGAQSKTAPTAMLDALRTKYVDYVHNKPTLGEAGDKFTDTNGQNPKTIYELRNEFGEPNPDSRKDQRWQNGWGKYWDKIPTVYSEYYEAYIQFRAQHKVYEPNGNYIKRVLDGNLCPYWLDRTITFVMPEFFRTTAISGQLNQVLVPKAAQSNHSNDVILQNKEESRNSVSGVGNVLGKVIETCLKAFKNNPVSESLKKVISSAAGFTGSFNVFAEPFYPNSDPEKENSETSRSNNVDCVKVMVNGKEGQAPYCALPANQGGDCTNQVDEFKVDKNNPNVICTFTIRWSHQMVLSAGPQENQFDNCSGGPIVTCTVAVSLWPIFEIPWQTEIWNNTLYSDTPADEQYIGSPLSQVKGRPGVYSFFTPVTVFEDELEANIRNCSRSPDPAVQACSDIINYVDQNAKEGDRETFHNCVQYALITNPKGMVQCVVGVAQHLEKKKPGKSTQQEEDISRRFIGGTDCSREWMGVSTVDKGVQPLLGVSNKCNLNASAAAPGTQPGVVNPPGSFPPTQDNCDGKYQLNNPVGNFGDPECNFSENALYELLKGLDPANADFWFFTVVSCESGYNPNSYNAASTAGQAFGLFQMGHAAYPQFGLDYQIADPATEYDRGDVSWQKQAANAINYNNQNLNGSFAYWACAQ